MCKLESDVITPTNRRFTTDMLMIACQTPEGDSTDHLLHSLNSYQPNIHVTYKENPNHFLDTAKQTGSTFTKSVYKKQRKLHAHWKCKTPIRWKRNSILIALHRARRISFNISLKRWLPLYIFTSNSYC